MVRGHRAVRPGVERRGGVHRPPRAGRLGLARGARVVQAALGDADHDVRTCHQRGDGGRRLGARVRAHRDAHQRGIGARGEAGGVERVADLEIGAIVAFNAYIVLLQVPFRFLGFFLILGQRARASAERIFEILDEQPEITDPEDPADPAVRDGRIELRDVRFGYGDGPDLLRGVDLVVEAGETIAIVGATGSGKSTLARLLCRYYDPRSGVVLLDGVDVRDQTVEQVRRSVVVVPDEPFLFAVSLLENLAYGRPDLVPEDGAVPAEILRAAEAVDAAEFVEAAAEGWDTPVGERGATLSGGQRQRLALGRALLVDPEVLVLDDATSAIDVQVEARIHRALTTVRAGRTLVLIAHRLSTITLASRVVLLDDGVIAASGTHAELLAGVPRYREILASGVVDDTVPAPPGTVDEGPTP